MPSSPKPGRLQKVKAAGSTETAGMEDDDELYRELYGEAAPEGGLVDDVKNEVATPSQAAGTGSHGAGVQQGAQAPAIARAKVEEGDEEAALYADGGVEAHGQDPQQQEQAQERQIEEDDDDLEVTLTDQRPFTEEEEEFEVRLDESSDAQPVGRSGSEASAAQRGNGRSTSQQPARAQLPASSTSAGTQPLSKPPGGTLPPSAPPVYSRPPTYPTYDPNDPGVLPSQVTAPGQRVRLPGQTRVTPEEYKEFLSLGHGDIFLLDIDNVVDAPWRAPGADPAEFFNYGMNPRTWKDYCSRVRQYQAEYKMQRRIQVYDRDKRERDTDLPPELAAAVRQRHRR